jgi:hypothetical protein
MNTDLSAVSLAEPNSVSEAARPNGGDVRFLDI